MRWDWESEWNTLIGCALFSLFILLVALLASMILTFIGVFK
jgi:hypothetical protein